MLCSICPIESAYHFVGGVPFLMPLYYNQIENVSRSAKFFGRSCPIRLVYVCEYGEHVGGNRAAGEPYRKRERLVGAAVVAVLAKRWHSLHLQG